MEIRHIYAVFFSPTGGTRHIVEGVTEFIAEKMKKEWSFIDFTLREKREKIYEFTEHDLVVVGSPVYAGRIPNKIAPDFIKCFQGNKTPVIPIVAYGNRSCGDALAELQQMMEQNGFCPIGAAAVVTRHAFTDKLAGNRPDKKDWDDMRRWCYDLIDKIKTKESKRYLKSLLGKELAPYYTPLTEAGMPAKFLKAKPITNKELCNRCGACAKVCPMNSIEENNVSEVSGVCIKCQACIRICSRHAKSFEDEQFLSHVRMLEKNFGERAENIYWI